MLFEFCAHFTPDRNILRHPGGGSIEKSQTQWVEWWRNILLPQKFAHPCQSFFYARAYKTFIVSVDVFSALTLRPKIANGLCSTGRAGVKGWHEESPVWRRHGRNAQQQDGVRPDGARGFRRGQDQPSTRP